jgi:hypothetical protein
MGLTRDIKATIDRFKIGPMIQNLLLTPNSIENQYMLPYCLLLFSVLLYDLYRANVGKVFDEL